MNRFLLIGMIFLVGFSCEKSLQVPFREIPEWLQKGIEEIESKIISDPKTIEKYCAWIRYEFRGQNYYEFYNPVSSFYPNLYAQDGEAPTGSEFSLQNYLTDRCCSQVIWKGPRYSGIH